MGYAPDPTDIYRNQTAILKWLQKRGHAVDMSPDPTVTAELFLDDPPMKRYNGQPCPYCGQTMQYGTARFPTREHIRPRRAGGTLAPNNRLIVCSPCNNEKGDMMLREFLRWLHARGDRREPIIQRLLDAGTDRYDSEHEMRQYLPRRRQR